MKVFLVGSYLGIALIWAVFSLPFYLMSNSSLLKWGLHSLFWPLTAISLLMMTGGCDP